MFYSVDGKIVQVGNAFPERRFNTLTFQTNSDKFPQKIGNFGFLSFTSPIPQSVTINFGDGVIETYPFTQDQYGDYVFRISDRTGLAIYIKDTDILDHTFVDAENNGTTRNISVTFQDASVLTTLTTYSINLTGIFPLEIILLKDLTTLTVLNTSLDSFPSDFSEIKKLTYLRFNSIFLTNEKRPKLEDAIFDNPLTYIDVSRVYDLSDPISSNFFKILLLKDSLDFGVFTATNIKFLPQNFGSTMTNLFKLDVNQNAIENPRELEALTGMTQLLYDVNLDVVDYFIDYTNFEFDLVTFSTNMSIEMTSQIPQVFKNFKKVKRFFTPFMFPFYEVGGHEAFIDNIYILVTNEGFLDPNSTEAQNSGYPYQFRDLIMDIRGRSFTQTIEAPFGFVLGSDNGNPTTQGEKLYVLINNYNSTINI